MENNNIVDELRSAAEESAVSWPNDAQLMWDAAEEIDRLRNEVISLTARLWNCQHEHPVDAIARRSDVGY